MNNNNNVFTLSVVVNTKHGEEFMCYFKLQGSTFIPESLLGSNVVDSTEEYRNSIWEQAVAFLASSGVKAETML